MHTSEPWELEEDVIGDAFWIIKRDSAETFTHIAEIYNSDDAHLVIAAPDLLEACELIDTQLKKEGYIPRKYKRRISVFLSDDEIKILQTAIAKARGDAA